MQNARSAVRADVSAAEPDVVARPARGLPEGTDPADLVRALRRSVRRVDAEGGYPVDLAPEGMTKTRRALRRQAPVCAEDARALRALARVLARTRGVRVA